MPCVSDFEQTRIANGKINAPAAGSLSASIRNEWEKHEITVAQTNDRPGGSPYSADHGSRVPRQIL